MADSPAGWLSFMDWMGANAGEGQRMGDALRGEATSREQAALEELAAANERGVRDVNASYGAGAPGQLMAYGDYVEAQRRMGSAASYGQALQTFEGRQAALQDKFGGQMNPFDAALLGGQDFGQAAGTGDRLSAEYSRRQGELDRYGRDEWALRQRQQQQQTDNLARQKAAYDKRKADEAARAQRQRMIDQERQYRSMYSTSRSGMADDYGYSDEQLYQSALERQKREDEASLQYPGKGRTSGL